MGKSDDPRTYPLEKQISLMDPDEYRILQEKAIKKLAGYSEDVYDFLDLVAHLGLEEVLPHGEIKLLSS